MFFFFKFCPQKESVYQISGSHPHLKDFLFIKTLLLHSELFFKSEEGEEVKRVSEAGVTARKNQRLHSMRIAAKTFTTTFTSNIKQRSRKLLPDRNQSPAESWSWFWFRKSKSPESGRTAAQLNR